MEKEKERNQTPPPPRQARTIDKSLPSSGEIYPTPTRYLTPPPWEGVNDGAGGQEWLGKPEKRVGIPFYSSQDSFGYK